MMLAAVAGGDEAVSCLPPFLFKRMPVGLFTGNEPVLARAQLEPDSVLVGVRRTDYTACSRYHT